MGVVRWLSRSEDVIQLLLTRDTSQGATMSEPKLTKFALVRPLGTSFRYPVSDMMTSHNDEFNRDSKHNQNYNLLYRGPKTVSVKRRAKSSDNRMDQDNNFP